MNQIVFIFPGQSSRYREMLARAMAQTSASGAIVREASEILGRNLQSELAPEAPALFSDNRNVQVGVFLVSHIYLRELAAHGIRPALSLGLSLGEYNHLVDIGAIDFADALKLVDARGRLYAQGPPGMMTSLFPADEAAVERILAEVGAGVAISNFNSPSQLVIAGPRAPTAQAAALFEEREFGQAAVIEDRIPMHTMLFRPVAEKLRPHLEAARFRKAPGPYIPNVTAAPIHRPEPAAIIESLFRHVFSPVQWRRCIDAVLALLPDAVFVEVGPKRVLCNLLARRWVGSERFAVDDQGIETIVSRLQKRVATAG
jgi:[acyl-carrier-protein] S-malonyltransferase